jgi:hypothetical protein
MAADEALAREAAVRSRMRRQQVANSLLVLLFAGAIVAAAVFLLARSDVWRRPARAPRIAAPAAPVRLPPPVAAVATSASVAVPLSTNAPSVAQVPHPKPKKPTPVAATSKARERASPPPIFATPPPPPAPTERSAYDYPSAGAAKRMLVSIKCLDQLAYEGKADGREFFSAICANGHRRQVSCAGAGCRIEYARPPSHLP